jgi:membrane protein YqaA with SNARE-associated domain
MDDLTFQGGYFGLLLVSFLAATLLPLSSEVAVAVMPRLGYDPTLTVAIATFGNYLGSVANYYVGAGAAGFLARYTGTGADRLARARTTYARWGAPILFFSWLPVVGDPLTLAAGALRVRFVVFTAWVVAGKLARYVVVVAAVQAI